MMDDVAPSTNDIIFDDAAQTLTGEIRDNNGVTSKIAAEALSKNTGLPASEAAKFLAERVAKKIEERPELADKPFYANRFARKAVEKEIEKTLADQGLLLQPPDVDSLVGNLHKAFPQLGGAVDAIVKGMIQDLQVDAWKAARQSPKALTSFIATTLQGKSLIEYLDTAARLELGVDPAVFETMTQELNKKADLQNAPLPTHDHYGMWTVEALKFGAGIMISAGEIALWLWTADPIRRAPGAEAAIEATFSQGMKLLAWGKIPEKGVEGLSRGHQLAILSMNHFIYGTTRFTWLNKKLEGKFGAEKEIETAFNSLSLDDQKKCMEGWKALAHDGELPVGTGGQVKLFKLSYGQKLTFGGNPGALQEFIKICDEKHKQAHEGLLSAAHALTQDLAPKMPAFTVDSADLLSDKYPAKGFLEYTLGYVHALEKSNLTDSQKLELGKITKQLDSLSSGRELDKRLEQAAMGAENTLAKRVDWAIKTTLAPLLRTADTLWREVELQKSVAAAIPQVTANSAAASQILNAAAGERLNLPVKVG